MWTTLLAVTAVMLSTSEASSPPRASSPVPLSRLTVSPGDPVERHRVPNGRAPPMRRHHPGRDGRGAAVAQPVALARLSSPPGVARASLDDVGPALARVEARTGVGVDVPRRRQEAIGFILSPPAATELETMLSVLEAELARYPESFLTELGIPRFYLAGAVEDHLGNEIGGFVVPRQPPLVVRPRCGDEDDVERVTLDPGTVVVSLGGVFRLQSLAHTIHHEIFHVVQERPEARRLLRGWASLNPEHSPYLGRSGQSYAQARSSYTAQRCFISRYSRSNESEDQAEVFAVLMTDPAAAQEQGVYDPCLGEKISRMRTVMDRLPEIAGLSEAAIR